MAEPLRILVIEDSNADFLMIKRHLKHNGLLARCSRVDTLDGLKVAIGRENWDLVLTDYDVPQLNFRESLNLLLTNLPDVPVILVTGTLGDEKAVDLLKLGVHDFVLKENLTRLVPAVLHSLNDKKELEMRRRSEIHLRESEERSRNILHTAMDGFLMSDSQGRVQEVNAKYCQMSGYSEQELLGMRIADLEVIETPDDVINRIQIITDAGEVRFESQNRRKDGSIFDVEVSAQFHRIGDGQIVAFLRDISKRKQTETYREMGREILQILNKSESLQDSIQRVLTELKKRTGFDAVGIRLQDGEDFPYLAQDGFSKDFLLTENTLIERNANDGVCLDKDGNVSLECTCGLVISGKTDPASPLFTSGGSFWTNDSFPLLDLPPDMDPRLHPRNQCIHEGFASVALVPIRNKDKIVGLIQFNDQRKGCFTQ